MTNGDCHDSGSTLPTSGSIIVGQVLETGIAGGHPVNISLRPLSPKEQRFASPLGGGCPTAAMIAATCTSANLNWSTAFPDNNYSVTCSLDSVTNQPHLVKVTKLAAGAGITVTIAADTANAANAGVECIAVHD
jgi:hypothetical protein